MAPMSAAITVFSAIFAEVIAPSAILAVVTLASLIFTVSTASAASLAAVTAVEANSPVVICVAAM